MGIDMLTLAGAGAFPLAFGGEDMTVVTVELGEFGEERSEPRVIGNVRFEDAAAIAAAASGAAPSGLAVQTDAVGVVFVDAANSPGAFDVPVGAVLKVGGRPEMTAARVSRLTDFSGRLHHWEIEVR